MKIKQGDMVVVLTGEDAKRGTPEFGKAREVLKVLEDGQKVLVKNVNEVFKHVKRGHPKSPSGGRLKMEMPIQSSNVAYYCQSCSKHGRLGLRKTDDGAKERFCKKCGTSAGIISPAKNSK